MVFSRQNDHRLIKKDTWESYESRWDLYLSLDVLLLEFIYRTTCDKIFNLSGFGVKDCLAYSYLGWELMMSMGQDKFFHTYTYIRTLDTF